MRDAEPPDEDNLGTFPADAFRGCATAAVIASTDLARGYHEPAWRESLATRIGVAFQPFRWDEGEPWCWLLTSVGLAALTQARSTFASVPSFLARFALVAHDFASWIAEDGDAFAMRQWSDRAALYAAGDHPFVQIAPLMGRSSRREALVGA